MSENPIAILESSETYRSLGQHQKSAVEFFLTVGFGDEFGSDGHVDRTAQYAKRLGARLSGSVMRNILLESLPAALLLHDRINMKGAEGPEHEAPEVFARYAPLPASEQETAALHAAYNIIIGLSQFPSEGKKDPLYPLIGNLRVKDMEETGQKKSKKNRVAAEGGVVSYLEFCHEHTAHVVAESIVKRVEDGHEKPEVAISAMKSALISPLKNLEWHYLGGSMDPIIGAVVRVGGTGALECLDAQLPKGKKLIGNWRVESVIRDVRKQYGDDSVAKRQIARECMACAAGRDAATLVIRLPPGKKSELLKR